MGSKTELTEKTMKCMWNWKEEQDRFGSEELHRTHEFLFYREVGHSREDEASWISNSIKELSKLINKPEKIGIHHQNKGKKDEKISNNDKKQMMDKQKIDTDINRW